ncbi:MAG: hypothetical protein AUI14_25510 [Actinobacteria bacterium 13_2_20CM_2_71_6]|nr:MAG: hypothetical protein AUI14_25510 [Actinobacteria bacterium 13_2_20CM_2_71_6]
MTSALDEQLPRWHHRERHAAAVTTPPDVTFAALDALTWREVPLFRVLMAIRSAGTTSRVGDRRILADFTSGVGFTEVARTDAELVYAGIGRPWSIRGGMRPVEPSGGVDAVDFIAFDEPGWAKMAVNFRVADGALTTETRVWLTDASARRAFAAYWLVIRPFSGLIRRTWLTATARHAEVIHRA